MPSVPRCVSRLPAARSRPSLGRSQAGYTSAMHMRHSMPGKRCPNRWTRVDKRQFQATPHLRRLAVFVLVPVERPFLQGRYLFHPC